MSDDMLTALCADVADALGRLDDPGCAATRSLVLSAASDRERVSALKGARPILARFGHYDLADRIGIMAVLPAPEPQQDVVADTMERAFDQGADAKANGLHRADNPHPRGSEERRAWFEGYDE